MSDLDESSGAVALRAAGFRFCAGVRTIDDDYDTQRHVNNAAIVRWCNQHRIRYAQGVLAPRWPDYLRSTASTVVARELHVLYESEGLPDDAFVCGTRVAIRQGKAALLEQQVVERGSGRVVARAWVVLLHVVGGAVVEFPAWYWDLVRTYETAGVIDEPPLPRTPWGPPS